MSFVDANPCPQCGRRCHHMAGINVPFSDPQYSFLVCWLCGVKRQFGHATVWTTIKNKTLAATENLI